MIVTPATSNDRKLIILRLISIAFFLIMLFAFCATGYLATHRQALQFDTAIFAWLQSIHSSFITNCVLIVTFLGSGYFLFPCYTLLVIYYVFIRKQIWFAVAVVLVAFLGTRLLYLMQDTFERVRPSNPLIPDVIGYGYPSGHSFASFVFAGIMSFLIVQKHLQTRWKCIIISALYECASIIASTRPYLRVHYPTDVLGGFYLSTLWMVPCWWVLYFFNKKYPRPLG